MQTLHPAVRLARLHQRTVLGLTLCAGLTGMTLAPARPAEPESSPVPPAKAQLPAIGVREVTQDGGTVEEGTIIKYRFTVTNRGGADLELMEVKPSCGCTVPRWDKVIKPAAQGVVEAEVNTAHFRGPFAKHLTVFSNDPERPHLDLALTARVSPLVQVDPGLVALLSVEDQPVTQEFTLERTGGHSMRILDVTTQPYLQTELIALQGQGRYKLRVTATPDTPLGRSSIPVIVRTDLPKADSLTLTLLLDRGIVTVPPSVFWSLPVGEINGRVESTLTISRAKEPFHVTAATVDDPKLQAKLETAREGQEYRVRLSYHGGWGVGQVQKTLTLATDDPKQPLIKVPVLAIVQQAVTQTTAAR
jgi:hypothetical protein